MLSCKPATAASHSLGGGGTLRLGPAGAAPRRRTCSSTSLAELRMRCLASCAREDGRE